MLAQVYVTLKTPVHLYPLVHVLNFVNKLMSQKEHFGLLFEVSPFSSWSFFVRMILQYSDLEMLWFLYYARWKLCRLKQVC